MELCLWADYEFGIPISSQTVAQHFSPYKNLFSAPRIHLKAQKIALNFQRNVVAFLQNIIWNCLE